MGKTIPDGDDRLRVLVVEPDPDLAHLLRVLLDEPDRDVVTAASFAEARDALERGPVALVLLDLFLPDADGRLLLTHLAEAPATAGVASLVLGTGVSERIRSECFSLGAHACFEKPFQPETLAAVVTSRLQRAREAGDGEGETDPLTGLPNRAGVRRCWERLEAEGPPVLVVFAIDRFEVVSERYGSKLSEKVLRTVADALWATLGETADVVGRWEGAEFCALVPRATEDVGALAGRAVEAVRGRDVEDPRGESFRVTVSAGVAEADGGSGLDALLEDARRRVGHAREAGGNRVDVPARRSERTRPRILVAEDDELTARILEHRLSRDGMDVDRYANGADAYAAALEEAPDLVILDVKMPGMDGFDLLTRLRKVPAYADIPIIMLTSMGNEADVVRGFEIGADDYVLKPFSPVELLARVSRLLEGR